MKISQAGNAPLLKCPTKNKILSLHSYIYMKEQAIDFFFFFAEQAIDMYT